MPFLTVGSENDKPIELFYQDLGKGRPVVLMHGWPMSNVMWEGQFGPLVDAGFRVIAYDRRGFGRSSWTFGGYNYDTLADDLGQLLKQLDLYDVTLVGFSMAGGEVARYISRSGPERIAGAVFAGAVTPFMLRTQDNSIGIGQKVFDEILQGLQDDRYGFLHGFAKAFYNWSAIGSNNISKEQLEFFTELAYSAQPHATVECAKAFSSTDFRVDLRKVNVPTLVIHGDADQTVPFDVSGKLTAASIPQAHLEVIADAPHGFPQTHTEQFNQALLTFLKS